jgi:hypothetical protein
MLRVRSVDLNLNGGLGLSIFLDRFMSTKFFYDFTFIDLGEYSEDIDGLNKYMETIDDEYQALIDFPACLAYKEQYKKFPNAKFIYLKRDIDSWVEKFKQTQGYLSHPNQLVFEELFCNFYFPTGKKMLQDLTESELREIYIRHDYEVVEFFKDNPNYIKIDLDDPEISSKLRDFLGLETTLEYQNSPVFGQN